MMCAAVCEVGPGKALDCWEMRLVSALPEVSAKAEGRGRQRLAVRTGGDDEVGTGGETKYRFRD